MQTIRCLRCNRILTNEVSINRGYGPKCFKIIMLNQNIHGPNNDELLDRIRKLELDNNFIKHQLKHKVFVGNHPDSELEWDIPQEVKEIKNETKIQLIVVIKELKVKFQIGPDETFDYHNILSPVNGRTEPEDPPIIIENLELITN